MRAYVAHHFNTHAGARILGLVVDSGVPGAGPALDVPVSIFAYRHAKEFWWGGKVKPFWEAAGYQIDFYSETWRGEHGGCVSDRVFNGCIEWMMARLRLRNNAHARRDDVVVSFSFYSTLYL